MQRFHKAIVVLVTTLAMSILGLLYVYQYITPRVLGPNQFPMEEVTNYCIGDRIRELASSQANVFIVKANKSISVHEIDSGRLIWSSIINTQGESFPAVTVSDNLFVTDRDRLLNFDLMTGKLYWAIQLEDNNTWIPDASEKFVLLNSVSGPIELYDVTSGNKLWEIMGGRGYTPAFIDEDLVYVIDRGIKALNAVTGQLLWQVTNHLATGMGTLSNGVLYYVEYPGDQTYDVVSFDIRTKSELWRQNFKDNSPRQFSVYHGYLFVVDSHALHKVDVNNGRTDWSKDLSDAQNLSFIEQKVFVLEQFHRRIHILDMTTGKDLAILEISLPQVLGDRAQEMVTVNDYLVFSRGCEVFIYGQ